MTMASLIIVRDETVLGATLAFVFLYPGRVRTSGFMSTS